MSEIKEGGIPPQEKESKTKEKLEELIGALNAITEGEKPEELEPSMVLDILIDKIDDWLKYAKEQGIDVTDFQKRYHNVMGIE